MNEFGHKLIIIFFLCGLCVFLLEMRGNNGRNDIDNIDVWGSLFLH